MLSNLDNTLILMNYSGREYIASQRYDSTLPHSPSPKGPRSRLESPSYRSPRQDPGSPGSPSLPEDPEVQAKLQQIDREIKRLDEIEKLKGEIFDLQIMQVIAKF